MTLKRRLLTFIISIILFISLIGIAMYFFTMYNNLQYSSLMSNLFYLNSLSKDINTASSDLESYIQHGTSETLDRYTDNMHNAMKRTGELKQNVNDQETYYTIVGLENLIQTFDKTNNEIIHNITLNKSSSFYDQLIASKKFEGFIYSRISDIYSSQIEISNKKYSALITSSQTIGFFALGILILVFGISILFSLRFTKRIVTPINKLTTYAKELAGGDFETDDLHFETTEEIAILTHSLNRMKKDIHKMFDDLKGKAKLEARLKRKELENLKILNDLKNSELKMLQSQINPHFLFNTLNSISRTAYMDGSHDTVRLIEALSEMLRYNLTRIEKPVTLNEEIENLKRYIFIQQTRFQNKLEIRVNVNSQYLYLPIPCLILQPLVENSIIHGLKPYDYNGQVVVDIYDKDEYVHIDISDNGVGMDEEMVSDILSLKLSPADLKSTGIGIQNVVNRLKAFYNYNDCLFVRSTVGEGSLITLKLKLLGGRANV